MQTLLVTSADIELFISNRSVNGSDYASRTVLRQKRANSGTEGFWRI
jgi:hypothetical protein